MEQARGKKPAWNSSTKVSQEGIKPLPGAKKKFASVKPVVSTRRPSSKVQEPAKANENKAQCLDVALVQQAAPKTTVIGKPAKMRNLMVDISFEMCCKNSKFYQEKKAEATISAKARGKRYVCLAPYFADTVSEMTMEEFPPGSPLSKAVDAMRGQGFGVHTGRWNIPGNPQVILLDTDPSQDENLEILNRIKQAAWEDPSLIRTVLWYEEEAVYESLADIFMQHLNRQTKIEKLTVRRPYNPNVNSLFTRAMTYQEL